MNRRKLTRAALTLITIGGLSALAAIWTGDPRWESTAALFTSFGFLFWIIAGLIFLCTDEKTAPPAHKLGAPRPFVDRP